MSALTPATYLAVALSAGEAHYLKSQYIENEHILVGLLKIEDFQESQTSPASDINEQQWQSALVEIASFRNILTDCDINCKNTRRRLRKLIIEHQGKPRKYSGHRSNRCKQMFAVAEEICASEGNEKITLANMTWAVLNMESKLIGQLFQEFVLDQKLFLY